MKGFLDRFFDRRAKARDRSKTNLKVKEFEDRATPVLPGLHGMFLLSSSYFPHTACHPARSQGRRSTRTPVVPRR